MNKFLILVGLLFPFSVLASKFDAVMENYPSIVATTSTSFTVDGLTSSLLRVTGGSSQSGVVFSVQDNAGTELLTVDEFGAMTMARSASQFNHGSTFSFRDIGGTTNGTSMLTYGSTVSSGFNYGAVFALSKTSGEQRLLRTTAGTFAPTSGSATFITYKADPTINQTGGASGVTYGFKTAPTLTAAAAWRDYEAGGSGAYSFASVGAAPNRVPFQESNTPAAPAACGATNVGSFQYVDDTNDSATADVCICVATGDDGSGSPNTFDWRSILTTAAACAEY